MKINLKQLKVLSCIAALVSAMSLTVAKLFGNGPIAVFVLAVIMAIFFPTFVSWYNEAYHLKTDIH